MRLQKFLAIAGIGSRRACEKLILTRSVSINGKIVSSPGVKIDPAVDRVAVNGCLVTNTQSFAYYILHKPSGMVTSLKDPKAGPTIAALLNRIPYRVYPVGRLDKDAEGLLFLTNDGELAFRLTHPRYKVWKSYLVCVAKKPANVSIKKLRHGVDLIDGKTSPAQVRILPQSTTKKLTLTLYKTCSFKPKEECHCLLLKIREGRKHQVKRMMEYIGYPVCYLSRVRIGPLRLGKLPKGRYRVLTAKEVSLLYAAAGLSK